MATTRPTSSRTGTFYFAYGSNLSPFQMKGRCPNSGTPIAIASLNSWSWIITERGYANVIPMRPGPISADTDASTVWGVLYNLTPTDEAALDRNEGWSESKKGSRNSVAQQRKWKPFEQGTSTYNKLYLLVRVEKWLVSNPRDAFGIQKAYHDGSGVRALVYVDENMTELGRIRQSYIRRMGRAARESIPLGIPESYIGNVMSQHGIDKNDPNSFTDDILPGKDANPPKKEEWEAIREQELLDDIEAKQRTSR